MESNRPPLPLSFDARPDSTTLSPMTETVGALHRPK
jgi:hypothetical protein